MSNNKFKIIACVDANNGIGRNNSIPWHIPEDLQWFKSQTEYCAVIMGRKTFESIGSMPLPRRTNIVVSRTLSDMGNESSNDTSSGDINSNQKTVDEQSINDKTIDEQSNDKSVDDKTDEKTNEPNMRESGAIVNHTSRRVIKVPDLQSALAAASTHTVWVIGGGTLYEEAIRHPACESLVITRLSGNYNCDAFFPPIPSSMFGHGEPCAMISHNTTSSRDSSSHDDNLIYPVYEYTRCNASETAYLDLLRRTLAEPLSDNRTSISTHSRFAEMLRYPLRDGFGRNIIPLFTTKFVPFRIVYEELLWFLRGGTNTQYLEEKKVKIWTLNSTREFLDNAGLHGYQPGELGPIYGHQWRNFNAPYKSLADVDDDVDKDVDKDDVDKDDDKYTPDDGDDVDDVNDAYIRDQIARVIHDIKTNPFSRRHVVSAWNPLQINEMALPPCHLMFIFNVKAGGNGDGSGDNNCNNILNCHLTIRSNDLFLGHPFNVASYAALTHMIAKICDLTPGELVITMVDAHIYANHDEAIRKQITRTPLSYPLVKFSDRIIAMDDLSIDDFESGDLSVENYEHLGRIAAPMVA